MEVPLRIGTIRGRSRQTFISIEVFKSDLTELTKEKMAGNIFVDEAFKQFIKRPAV